MAKAAGPLIGAIYFDTNVSRKMGKYLSAGWIQQLATDSRQSMTKLYVPQIVLDEWLWEIRRDCKESLGTIRAKQSELDRLCERSIVGLNLPRDEDVLKAVEDAHIRRIAALGLNPIPTAEGNLRSLLLRAIQKDPPFGSGDKGFRDAMIVETIRSHVSANHSGELVLVASEDEQVCKAIVGLASGGLSVRACAHDKLSETIVESLGAAEQEGRAHETQLALTFLNENRDMIFRYVLSRDISEAGLKYGRDEFDPLRRGTIRRINKVTPKNIETLMLKHGFLDSASPGEAVPIWFYVNVELDVTVEPLTFPFDERRISLGGSGELPPRTWASAPKKDENVVAETSVHVWGIAKKTADPSHPLTDLRIVEQDAFSAELVKDDAAAPAAEHKP